MEGFQQNIYDNNPLQHKKDVYLPRPMAWSNIHFYMLRGLLSLDICQNLPITTVYSIPCYISFHLIFNFYWSLWCTHVHQVFILCTFVHWALFLSKFVSRGYDFVYHVHKGFILNTCMCTLTTFFMYICTKDFPLYQK